MGQDLEKIQMPTEYDLSMKQKLPIKGLELYLNISNLTEAVDITGTERIQSI